jgi:hypothetical protein
MPRRPVRFCARCQRTDVSTSPDGMRGRPRARNRPNAVPSCSASQGDFAHPTKLIGDGATTCSVLPCRPRTGGIIMACAITSLILVAMFGVMAVGLVGSPASTETGRLAKTGAPPRAARAAQRDPGAFQVRGWPVSTCRRGRPALDQWRRLLAFPKKSRPGAIVRRYKLEQSPELAWLDCKRRR